MGSDIKICSFFAITFLVAFVGQQADAQTAQGELRRLQGEALAAAAGPEFQRTGYATMGPSARARGFKRPQTSGPFAPQPYQSSRNELAQSQQPQQQASNQPAQRLAASPSMVDLSGRPPGAPNPYEWLSEGHYSAVLEARSRRIFPWASQEEERQKWMAMQEQQSIANEINRTKPLIYPAR